MISETLRTVLAQGMNNQTAQQGRLLHTLPIPVQNPEPTPKNINPEETTPSQATYKPTGSPAQPSAQYFTALEHPQK